jgi:anti-sigma-K factor RskA
LNKEDIISSGLLELYVMGLSSAEETKQVEDSVKQYPEIKKEIEAIEMSLESYAQTHAIEPSSSVKDKILSRISIEDQNKNVENSAENSNHIQAPIYRIPSLFKLAAAAMIALLIGSIALNYSYYQKYKAANNDLQLAQNDIKTLQEKAEQNQQANVEMKNEMNVIGDKNSLPVVLKGTPHSPDAVAKIYWVKTSGDVYVDPTNLPSVPTGMQYQLWAIVDGKPVDAGMISTVKGIYHIQKMKSFGQAQAFAITLEKAGGSPTPNMEEMYVISKI